MSAVVTGYASLDYTVTLDRAPEPDRTATVLSRASEFPRLGGSPAYVAAAMVAAGLRDAAPVTWVGDDAEGQRYRAALEALGVRSDGVAIRPGRTPVCVLAYQPEGGCHCFYHPSFERAAPPRRRTTQTRGGRRHGLRDGRAGNGDARGPCRRSATCDRRLGGEGGPQSRAARSR